MKPSSSKSVLPAIILASTSPRRIEFMKSVGIEVTVMKPDIDEIHMRGEPPRELVARLAREKAECVAERVSDDVALVIAADTIVISPDGKKILGKPRDERDARRMLASLSGKSHEVLTGYCLLPTWGDGRPRIRVVSTKVKFRKLSREDIARYVATGEPMDKAGAYGIQGLGMTLVDEVRGSYTNVVGLPMSQLLMDLEKRFGVPLFPKVKL